ncbi:unnamed protein product [Lactuca saligna]|uniref:Uncharacterized protein n=1 Tax=Lactuca saligna TaxID=75948 RepID=A0AA35VY81_LACSI|nr:unnamed protein product [Lactuca saligna]
MELSQNTPEAIFVPSSQLRFDNGRWSRYKNFTSPFGTLLYRPIKLPKSTSLLQERISWMMKNKETYYYCLQGLFHPARKVREVYWKIYNSLYIGAQDALVAAYLVLEDEGENVYSRPELTLFI